MRNRSERREFDLNQPRARDLEVKLRARASAGEEPVDNF